jgi:hypothetical protein
MAKVAIVIYGHAANVEAHLAGFDGDEFLGGAGERVIDFQHD